MLKSDIQILIVDDDPSIVKALSTALSRDGFSCRATSSIDEARSLFRHTEFHIVILDCVLPVISGIDLGQELRKAHGDEFKLFLTSGIFKDPHFIKESTNKTNASDFFSKPFDIGKVLASINNSIEGSVQPDRDPLTKLLFDEIPSDSEVVSLINNLEQIDANLLTILYSILNKSKLSGQLNLVYSEGDISSIGFKNGSVNEVHVKDASSYFGILLVENGFCTAKDVEENLALQNGLRIGETMTISNSLSPHAIQVVQLEQMAIRMSSTIRPSSVKPIFIEQDIPTLDDEVLLHDMTRHTLDWVMTKVSTKWINTFFVPWLDYSFVTTPQFTRFDELATLPAFRDFSDLKSSLCNHMSIQEMLENIDPSASDSYLRALFFLLLENQVRINPSAKSSSSLDGKLKRLTKIMADMENQNHFEVLGLNSDAHRKSIQNSYHELAKALHPDKLPSNAPSELKEVTTKLFARITLAYQVLNNNNSRQEYLKELEYGTAEKALEAECLFDDGLAAMQRHRAKDALPLFLEAKKSGIRKSDIDIYVAWAKLKIGAPDSQLNELYSEIKRTLNKVPPEERHTYMFFFIKGLYYRMTQRYDKAKTYYTNCLVLNSQFAEARKELKAIERYIDTEDTQDFTAHGVVTAIVSNFFTSGKKKKSS